MWEGWTHGRTGRLAFGAGLSLVALTLGCGSPPSLTHTSPTTVVESSLVAVTCPAPTDCVAVGYAKNYHTDLLSPLIEENKGEGWKIVPSPGIATGLGSRLGDVVCPSPKRCIAVGASLNAASLSRTLILENRGNGWSIVPSPNAIAFGHETGSLNGVACATPSRCMAVGSYEGDDGGFRTLIEEDVGNGWAVASNPDPDVGEGRLTKITCGPTYRCLAIGSIAIEHSGAGWSRIDYPGPGTYAGIDCSPLNLCVAVGLQSEDCCPLDFLPSISERAQGAWTVIGPGGLRGVLEAVTCPTSDHCIAVGQGSVGAFMEERTKNGWAVVDSSSLGSTPTTLRGVTCVSSSHCIAVGDHVGTAMVGVAFIAETTGKSWSAVASPVVEATPAP